MLQRSTPSSCRISSASRTIPSARRWVMYAACASRRVARDVADRRRAAGAALVDQEHPVVGDRALLPARRRRRGARRLAAGAALEEQEVRPVLAVGRGDLAGEDRDRLARPGSAWSSGTRVLALGEDRAGDAVRRRPSADPALAQRGDRLLDAAGAGLGVLRAGHLEHVPALVRVRQPVEGCPGGRRRRRAPRRGPAGP